MPRAVDDCCAYPPPVPLGCEPALWSDAGVAPERDAWSVGGLLAGASGLAPPGWGNCVAACPSVGNATTAGSQSEKPGRHTRSAGFKCPPRMKRPISASLSGPYCLPSRAMYHWISGGMTVMGSSSPSAARRVLHSCLRSRVGRCLTKPRLANSRLAITGFRAAPQFNHTAQCTRDANPQPSQALSTSRPGPSIATLQSQHCVATARCYNLDVSRAGDLDTSPRQTRTQQAGRSKANQPLISRSGESLARCLSSVAIRCPP